LTHTQAPRVTYFFPTVTTIAVPVARYADACNIRDSDELAHKLDVLRAHCAAEGRDYAEIEKTVQTIEHLHALAELGVQAAHGSVTDVGSLRPLELMGERVIPAIEKS
jgi:hypothetical protein